MIVLCSIKDRKHHFGKVYYTTAVQMDNMPCLEFLCPTKELVWGHKYHGKSDEWYIDGYRSLMTKRWGQVNRWLKSLGKNDSMTLVCYCEEGKFCHRQLVAKMIAIHRPDIALIIH